jgi:hypothetical protein
MISGMGPFRLSALGQGSVEAQLRRPYALDAAQIGTFRLGIENT